MGDHQHPDATHDERVEQLEHHRCVVGVEVARRLVAQQDVGVTKKRPGDRNTLSFAA